MPMASMRRSARRDRGPELAVRLQRAYEEPQSDDGVRVLVDRVWPRGRTKEQLRLDRWDREVAPSTKLRRWFGHDPGRWQEFRSRYRAELAQPAQDAILDELVNLARHGTLTIVFGARDTEHSQARVIVDEIEARLAS